MDSTTVTNNAGSYSIKILRNNNEIEEMRHVWEQLQYHPNADINFFNNIINIRKDILRPHIIILYANDQPKVMIIGRIDKGTLNIKIGYKSIWKPKVRILSIIYGGIMGDVSSDIADRIISEIIMSLKGNEADVAFFSNIRTDSMIYSSAKRNPNLLCRDYITTANLHWKMTLPNSIDEFYKKMKAKHRYWIKRLEKILEKEYPGKVIIISYQKEIEIAKFCKDAEQISKKTYQRGLGVGFIDNDENRQRLQLSAHNNWLRAYILYIDEKPCAFWMGTLYKKTFYLDFTGYDQYYKKYEPGTILFMEMINKLCREEVAEIDFGLGNAFYKERFGDQHWEEAFVYIYSRTLRGIVLNFVRTLSVLISAAAEKVINRLALRNKLKKIWRKKLIPTVVPR